MPIISIKTIKGALSSEKKRELHRRISDLMVEVEGNGNKEFGKYVVVTIDEDIPENFSIDGRQASEEFTQKITNKN